MAKTQSAGKRNKRRTRSKKRGSRKCSGGDGHGAEPAPASLNNLDSMEKVPEQAGGRKRRGKKGKKSKRKMNEFFRLLIDAKKKNKESFSYKGKTYKRKVGTKKNPKLVVYTKA
tara:strand:- start:68 stop:409 length:342 start_codon:yes stop_codon:yes gene_type:complete